MKKASPSDLISVFIQDGEIKGIICPNKYDDQVNLFVLNVHFSFPLMQKYYNKFKFNFLPINPNLRMKIHNKS